MKLLSFNDVVFIHVKTSGPHLVNDGISEISLRTYGDNVTERNWQLVSAPGNLKKANAYTSEIEVFAKPSVRFEQIAREIVLLTQNKLLITTHSAVQYGFLKRAFKTLGYSYKVSMLSISELINELYPEMKEKHLSCIAKRFNLELPTLADAVSHTRFLASLFENIQRTFSPDTVCGVFSALLRKNHLPPHLNQQIKDIPTSAGVYLFYGEQEGQPLYIGKSINLRQRVLSHFSNRHIDNKELQLHQRTKRIDWIECSGEFGALLLESQLIKKHRPLFNRKLRKLKRFASFLVKQHNGYWGVETIVQDNKQFVGNPNTWGTFRSRYHANEVLTQLVKTFKLCPKLCSLENGKGACFHYQLKRCQGACLNLEGPDEYNRRVEQALHGYVKLEWPFEGTIAIKEGKNNAGFAFHVFEQWRYLGSWPSLAGARDALQLGQAGIDDIDAVQLLHNYLADPAHKHTVFSIAGDEAETAI